MRWATLSSPGDAVVDHDAEVTASQELQSAAASIDGPSLVVHLRQLDGVELLNFMGFDSTYLVGQWPSHTLATSLAGNAFNGFNLIPCVIALFAVVEPDCTFVRAGAGVDDDACDEA